MLMIGQHAWKGRAGRMDHRTSSTFLLKNALGAMTANKLIKSAMTFYQTRRDWLGGDGEFVDADDAQKRADTCLFGNGGKKCPHNREMPLFEILTSAAAHATIAQLKVKDKLGLKLNMEHELHTCDVCLCNLKLKPWVPSKYIRVSFKQEELPDYCWMHELFDKTQPQELNDNKAMPLDGAPKDAA